MRPLLLFLGFLIGLQLVMVLSRPTCSLGYEWSVKLNRCVKTQEMASVIR